MRFVYDGHMMQRSEIFLFGTSFHKFGGICPLHAGNLLPTNLVVENPGVNEGSRWQRCLLIVLID